MISTTSFSNLLTYSHLPSSQYLSELLTDIKASISLPKADIRLNTIIDSASNALPALPSYEAYSKVFLNFFGNYNTQIVTNYVNSATQFAYQYFPAEINATAIINSSTDYALNLVRDGVKWAINHNALSYAFIGYTSYRFLSTSYLHYQRGEYIDSALFLTGALGLAASHYSGQNLSQFGGFFTVFQATQTGLNWARGKATLPSLKNTFNAFYLNKGISNVPLLAQSVSNDGVVQLAFAVLSGISLYTVNNQGTAKILNWTNKIYKERSNSIINKALNGSSLNVSEFNQLISSLGKMSNADDRRHILLSDILNNVDQGFLKEAFKRTHVLSVTPIEQIKAEYDYYRNLRGTLKGYSEFFKNNNQNLITALKENYASNEKLKESFNDVNLYLLNQLKSILSIMVQLNKLPESDIKTILGINKSDDQGKTVVSDNMRFIEHLIKVASQIKKGSEYSGLKLDKAFIKNLEWQNLYQLCLKVKNNSSVSLVPAASMSVSPEPASSSSTSPARPLLLSGGPASGMAAATPTPSFVQSERKSYMSQAESWLANPISSIRRLINPLSSRRFSF